MAAGVPLSFRTDEDTATHLDKLVSATDRPRAWHLEQALKGYLREQAWQVDDIRAGLAEAEAGAFASDDEIAVAFASFRDPPET